MKKEDIASFIVYILMILLAVILGFTLVKNMFEMYVKSYGSTAMNQYLFAIIVIVVGILINAFGLELGHIIGGKLGGYSIVSIDVFGLCLIKIDGKFKLKFKDYDGLTGETVLKPNKEKCNPKPYVWIPLVLYLIELTGCIILYSLGKGVNTNSESPLIWLGTAAIIFITISSMMALYNFVPVKLDSMTDGYRLTLISKPINVEAYNELLRIENCQREGVAPGEIKVFEEITDFTASINMITIYEYLSKKEYARALEMIDKMLDASDKISNTLKNRLIAQKLYIKLMTLPLEEAKKFYDEEVSDNIRRFISNDLSMESIRAYVLIAGMLDESTGEVEFANSRKPKAMKRSLKSRAEIEEKLYNEAIEIVKKTHPDWDLSNIK